MTDLDPIPPDAPPVDADTAPAPTKPKRDRSKRNTGNPPGRPPKAASDKAPAAPPRGRPTTATLRERRYTASLARLAVLIYALNEADGLVFMQGIPRTAKALANVAEQNPAIGKILDAGVKSGAWLELGAALGAFGVPMLVNHGKLPPIAGVLMSGDVAAFMAAQPAPAPPAAEPAPAAGPVPTPTPTMAPETSPGLVEGFTVAGTA